MRNKILNMALFTLAIYAMFKDCKRNSLEAMDKAVHKELYHTNACQRRNCLRHDLPTSHDYLKKFIVLATA